MTKINLGCFNSNIDGWIGVDHALRHIILSRIPFLSWLLWKIKILNSEQYRWHKEGLFKFVKYGDVTKKLKFRTSSVDFIYSSHLLEHLWRDDAIFFLKECFRILKKDGVIRICVPDWNIFKIQETFENSLFARKKAELRLSHKWCWSFVELKQYLHKIGFRNISRHDFQAGDFPDLGKLEHRDGLIIQAQK
jgi:SAM-dependent methyltransferase